MRTDETELDPEARCAIRRRLSDGVAVRARPADLLDAVLEACRPGADSVLAAPVQRRLGALRARVLAGRNG